MAFTKIQKDDDFDTKWTKQLTLQVNNNLYFNKDDIMEVFKQKAVKGKITGLTIKLATLVDSKNVRQEDIPVLLAICDKTPEGYLTIYDDIGNVIALACPPIRIQTSKYFSYKDIFGLLSNN